MTNVKDIRAGANAQPEDRRAGVTLRNADCNNRVLHGALEKLDEYTGFSAQDMSRFNKIKGAYDSRSKEVSRLFKKLIDKHAHHEPVVDPKTQKTVLKDNGKPRMKPKMVPTGRGRMDFDFKDRKAFNADYTVLMSEEFKIEAYQLLTEDLVKAGLTPKEIRACAKLLSDADPELLQDSPIYDDEELEDDDEQEGPSDAQNGASEALGASEVPKAHDGSASAPAAN